MPKRKAATSKSTTKKASKKSSSATTKSKKASSSTAEETFANYADSENPQVITLEGISQLTEALGLEPTDIRSLLLCWFLGPNSKPGEINEEDFLNGMASLNAFSVADIGSLLSTKKFDVSRLDKQEFRDFYRYCFRFNLEGTYRTLSTEEVMDLLPLVIGDHSQFTDKFIEFLPTNGVTRISGDQWNSFLEFSVEVSDDLSNYDEDAAWPVLIDEFVVWLKQQSA